jgi:hypothetical protein
MKTVLRAHGTITTCARTAALIAAASALGGCWLSHLGRSYEILEELTEPPNCIETGPAMPHDEYRLELKDWDEGVSARLFRKHTRTDVYEARRVQRWRHQCTSEGDAELEDALFACFLDVILVVPIFLDVYLASVGHDLDPFSPCGYVSIHTKTLDRKRWSEPAVEWRATAAELRAEADGGELPVAGVDDEGRTRFRVLRAHADNVPAGQSMVIRAVGRVDGAEKARAQWTLPPERLQRLPAPRK